MKKLCIAIIAGVLVSNLSFAQIGVFKIPFGSSLVEAKDIAKTMNFDFVQMDGNTYHFESDKFMTYESVMGLTFKEDKLASGIITMKVPPLDANTTYYFMKDKWRDFYTDAIIISGNDVDMGLNWVMSDIFFTDDYFNIIALHKTNNGQYGIFLIYTDKTKK